MNSEQIVNNDESSENNENNIKKIKESYVTTGAITILNIFSVVQNSIISRTCSPINLHRFKPLHICAKQLRVTSYISNIMK